jgi:hypothetical protein
MGRTIAVFCLLLALVGVAVAEQIYIGRVYRHMKAETAALIALVDTYPDEGTDFDQYLKTQIDDMYEYWTGREKKLCILIKHIDLLNISNAIIYAQNFVHNDNKEETLAGLRQLAYLIDSYHAIYGFNGANIL